MKALVLICPHVKITLSERNSNHTNFLIPTHLGKSLCKAGVLGGQF